MVEPEELKERGQAMMKLIAESVEKHKEIIRTLAELEVSAKLMLQGIDTNEVQTLGYDPKIDKRSRGMAGLLKLPRVYNYVRLHSGERKEIDPIPCHKS